MSDEQPDEEAEGTDPQRGRNWATIGAVGAAVVTLLSLAAVALVLNGPLAALAFGVALVIGVATPLTCIYLLKDGTPLAGLWAKGTALLAQFTFGRSALVRRADGSYEWSKLYEIDGRYAVELSDGTVLNPDGDRGDLYQFAGRPLAILEEKGQNVEEFTVDEQPPETADKSTRETRADLDIHHPSQLRSDSYLISLKQFAAPAEGSAGPKLAQRGRAKALEEAGGQQGFSGFWLTIFAGVMVLTGFVLGFGALAL